MKKETKDWGKRFDEKFEHSEFCIAQRFEDQANKCEGQWDCYCQLRDIKSFIRQELEVQRKEFIEILEELAGELEEVRTGNSVIDNFNSGVNAKRQEIINKIKELNEKE